MPGLLTIPNEILNEIVSYLDPLATSYLLITCRSLSSLLTPAMLLHAVDPKDGENALHWASRQGHLPLVQYLLTRFPVDILNSLGLTPLHSAARSCANTLVIEHLLLHGAVVNRRCSSGITALHYVCRSPWITELSARASRTELSAEARRTDVRAEATIRLLIAHGADVHGEPPQIPLRTALASRFTRAARLLLDAGASPDARSAHGQPLILSAARLAETAEFLELFLDYGADIDACNYYDSNALLYAAQNGHLEMTKMLVARGANLRCANDAADTPLILAIKYGGRDTAEYLVGLDDVDIKSGNHDGENPVYLAVLMGYDTVLQTLLERGASTHILDIRGETTLYTAVRSGRETTVNTLLDYGANIETLNAAGFTPLLSAIQARNASMAMLLLDRGADPAYTGPDGLSPLTTACQCGLNTIVGLLLEKGVDINSVGEDELTAMSHAGIVGNSSVVEILTANGGISLDGE